MDAGSGPGFAHQTRSADGRRGWLTQRQLEVVGLVARGLANKEIAARLGISRRAVEALLTRIFARLSVENRTALIALALSEAGFGLARLRRTAPPSAIGALGVQGSVDEQTAAYVDAPFMVAVTHGADHRYTFVNRAAAEVAGRAAETLVGRSVLELYPDIPPMFIAALDACYRQGLPQSINSSPARWTHDDGSFRDSYVDLVFQPLRDSTGSVVGLLHIGTEIDAPDD